MLTKPALFVLGVSLCNAQNSRLPLQLAGNYDRLPLAFEPNGGQTDGSVKFLSRGKGYSLFLTGDRVVLSFNPSPVRSEDRTRCSNSAFGPSDFPHLDPWYSFFTASNAPCSWTSTRDNSIVQLRLVGANSAVEANGVGELPGKTNYFLGNDLGKWRINVPNYSKVEFRDVYPGVDMVFYGDQAGQLEYDFIVNPGADPAVINLDVGADLINAAADQPLEIAANGDLLAKAGAGEVRFHSP